VVDSTDSGEKCVQYGIEIRGREEREEERRGGALQGWRCGGGCGSGEAGASGVCALVPEEEGGS
jgi:hypothetical protein